MPEKMEVEPTTTATTPPPPPAPPVLSPQEQLIAGARALRVWPRECATHPGSPTCLSNCCVSAIARADLSAAFAVLERFVNAREPRHMVQALRVLGPFRKKGKESPGVAVGALMAALSTHVAPSAALRAPMLALLGMLPQPAEPVPAPAASEDKDDEKKASISKLPENEVLVGLLVLTLLLDHNQVIAAVPFSLQLMERVGALKRRTLDPIAERVYFYASWAHEVNGTLVAIRSPLLAAHRTACLHHNSTCQATLLNLLLRNYQVRLPPRPHHPPGRASSVGVSPPLIGQHRVPPSYHAHRVRSP